MKIFPIHGNIKELEYDAQWFKQFDIVLNALDNLGMSQLITSNNHTDFTLSQLLTDARRHVNKMCMAANIPLVESGTAGYLGQVQPLLKVSLRSLTYLNDSPMICRILPSVLIVFLNLRRKPFLSVRSGQHRANQYTA